MKEVVSNFLKVKLMLCHVCIHPQKYTSVQYKEVFKIRLNYTFSPHFCSKI